MPHRSRVSASGIAQFITITILSVLFIPRFADIDGDGDAGVALASMQSNNITVLVTLGPSITSISPSSDVVETSVTITGSNFGAIQGTSAITFSGTEAAVSSWSNTQIIATVPPAATTGPVVTTVNGISSNRNKIFTLLIDSDNDRMPDIWEIAHGLNPDDPADAGQDLDGDGLSNLEEYQNGADPHNPDTDGDGLSDRWEVANGTNPHDPDTDGDGMLDSWETVNGLDPTIPITNAVTTLATGLYNPGGIAVNNSYLYLTEVLCSSSGLSSISKISLNYRWQMTLASGLSYPWGIVVDSDYIYFSKNSMENGAVSRIPLNGGSVEDLATGLFAPALITKDNTHLYWPEERTGGGNNIRSVPLSGGTVTTLTSSLGDVLMVAVDNDYAYWADYVEGTINRVSKSGGAAVTLAAGLNVPTYVAVDESHVYWTEAGMGSNDGAIKKISRDGGTVATVASGINSPLSLVIDSYYIYWTEGFTLNTTQNNGGVRAVPQTGGTVITIAQGLNNPAFTTADDNYIYWTEGTIISPDAGCPTIPPPDGTIKRALKLNPVVGTWGYQVLGHGSESTIWRSEAGIAIFNNDGTGTIIYEMNEDGALNSDWIDVTYSIALGPDGSYSWTLTTPDGTSIKRRIISDDGRIVLGDGTSGTGEEMVVFIRSNASRTYTDADMSGEYYYTGYEYDAGGGSSGYHRASSGVLTADGNGNYSSDEFVNEDGAISSRTESGTYSVNIDGSVIWDGGTGNSYLSGDGRLFILSLPDNANKYAGYLFIKKGDRQYTTADIAGEWAIVSFGDEEGTGFNAGIGSMSCNPDGDCMINSKKQSDGNVTYEYYGQTFSISPDGSLGDSRNPGAPSYAGAIGNNANTVIFNMSFNQDQLFHREIFIGVRCQKCFNLSGREITPPEGFTVSDSGVYSVDNTYLSVEWPTVTPESWIYGYAYQIGTSPGFGNIQDWTFISNSGPQNLSASLYYGWTYYACVRAIYRAGLETSPVCTDGITVIDPLTDPDGDEYANQAEVAAWSDPFNPDSIPGTTTLSLHAGFNLVSFPAETLYYENILNLMKAIGGNDVVSRVLVFDPVSKTFDEIGFDETGQFYGQNLSLLSGKGLIGLIVYAKQDASFTFTSQYCPTWDLLAGTNLVGTPCAAPDMTAFQLLQKIIGGETVVSSIQRFNPNTGQFEIAGYHNGQPAGVDFLIVPGDGYFIHMKQEVLGFMP